MCAVTAPAASPVVDPDSDLPMGHWAYDVLTMMQRMGFDIGIPDGTYAGRRAFTRREAAQCTATMAGQARYFANVGWERPWSHSRSFRFRQEKTPLAALATEFRSELDLIGANRVEMADTLRRFERVWVDGRPQGVEAPLVSSPRAYDHAARGAGLFRALRDRGWETRTLLSLRKPQEPPDGSARGIALTYADVSVTDNAARETVAGHNAAVWLRVRENHVTSGNVDQIWLTGVFDLSAYWAKHGSSALPLTYRGRGIDYRRTNWRLVWARESWHPNALTFGPEGKGVELRVPRLPRRGELEVLWGPTATATVFLRHRVTDDAELPYRIYAMDLRTGEVLNAAAAK